jgi:hypothetical protein
MRKNTWRNRLLKERGNEVKTLIAFALIFCLVLTTQMSFGRGNQRANINHKWKKVEAWQKRQDDRLKRIEMEAQRSLLGTRGQDGSSERTPYPKCRTCP